MSPVQMVRSAKLVMSKHRHASVAMAGFIINSAFLTTIRSSAVLMTVPSSGLSWALRNSSGVGEGIYKSVVQSDREFLNIWVGDRC